MTPLNTSRRRRCHNTAVRSLGCTCKRPHAALGSNKRTRAHPWLGEKRKRARTPRQTSNGNTCARLAASKTASAGGDTHPTTTVLLTTGGLSRGEPAGLPASSMAGRRTARARSRLVAVPYSWMVRFGFSLVSRPHGFRLMVRFLHVTDTGIPLEGTIHSNPGVDELTVWLCSALPCCSFDLQTAASCWLASLVRMKANVSLLPCVTLAYKQCGHYRGQSLATASISYLMTTYVTKENG